MEEQDVFCLENKELSMERGSSSAAAASASNALLAPLLFSKMTCFQATQFKTLLNQCEPATFTQFLDCYLKGINSVVMYRNKPVAENRLLYLFQLYDTDRDGLISFAELPLTEPLIGVDPSTEKTEIVVYDDVPAECPFNPVPLSKLGYEFELDELTNLQYQPHLGLYSVSCRNDVLLFQITESFRSDAVTVLKEHRAPVLCVVHVPHLKRLLTTSADRSIVAWNEAEKNWSLSEKVRVFCTQTCLAYDPVTQWVVSGGTDGCIYLYKTLPQLSPAFKRIQAHTEWVMEVAIIPDLEAIASCSTDGYLVLWERGTLAARSKKYSKGTALSKMRYARGSRSLFTVSSGRDIIVWNPFLANPTEQLKHEKPLCGIECFSQSPELVTADLAGRISVWDTRKNSTVQCLGAPDSLFPIGPINSMAYNSTKSNIVTLGSKGIRMFYPQKGSYTALMDIPVAALLYCNVSKRIVAAMGNRVLVFELTTGELLYSHSLGSFEISCAALCSSQLDLVLGTLEGNIVAVQAGGWYVSKAISVQDQVRFVFDLGRRSRLLYLSTENPRALAVTASGMLWHFAYGTLAEAVAHTTQSVKTPLTEVDTVSFSPQYGLAALTHKQKVVIFDVISLYQKSTQLLDSWVTSSICSDDLHAAIFSTAQGTIFGFHLTTMVQVFKIAFTPGIKVTSLKVDRVAWTLSICSPSRIHVLGMTRLFTDIRKHHVQRLTTMKAPRLLRNGRYVVDTIMDSVQRPLMLQCRINGTLEEEEDELSLSSDEDEESPTDEEEDALVQAGSGTVGLDLQPSPDSPLATLLITECASTADTIADIQRLRRMQERNPITGVLKVLDSWVPSVVDRCYSTSRPAVYSIVPHISLTKCALDVFSEISHRNIGRTEVEMRAVMELRWLLYCAAESLQSLAAQNVVALFEAEDLRLVDGRYVFALRYGVKEIGADRSALDSRFEGLSLTPPEGASCHPTMDCWLLGQLVYRLVFGRRVIPDNMSPQQVATLFDSASRASLVELKELESTWPAFLRDPELMKCVHMLLHLNSASRWSASDVLNCLGFEAAPRHLMCEPLPTAGDPKLGFSVSSEEIDRYTVTEIPTVLPRGTICALTNCLIPTLFLVAEFNGISCHIVIHNKLGKACGMVPPNNHVRIQWTVDREEVKNARAAVEDDSVGLKSKRTDNRQKRTTEQLGSEKYNPERFCPFYTETQSLRSRDVDILGSTERPYYLEGWWKTKPGRPLHFHLSSKKVSETLEKERERAKDTMKWTTKNEFYCDRIASALTNEGDETTVQDRQIEYDRHLFTQAKLKSLSGKIAEAGLQDLMTGGGIEDEWLLLPNFHASKSLRTPMTKSSHQKGKHTTLPFLKPSRSRTSFM